MWNAILGIIFAGTVFGQSFDAASIKPSPPPAGGPRRTGSIGGPGTKDPGLYTCQNCTLSMLIMQAYDLKRYQLSLSPALDEAKFNITARIPDGATKEQFLMMLQNLLADRFKLTVHHEKKEIAVYDLVVAKNGPKLKESGPAPPPPVRDKEIGKDGFPVPLAFQPGSVSFSMQQGRSRMQAGSQTMDQFANFLANQLGKPVTDATGLKGKYDLSLTFASDGMNMGMSTPVSPQPAEASEPIPDIPGAIQQQLGLRLDAKKGMIDTVVVDHADRTPTEN